MNFVERSTLSVRIKSTKMDPLLRRKNIPRRCFSTPSTSIDSSSSSGPSTPLFCNGTFELPEFEIRSMTNDDQEQVSDLIIETFFRDEPLNRCLKFDIPDEPLDFTKTILSSSIRDQYSFVVVDKQRDKIIGVILNEIENRTDSEKNNCFNKNQYESEKLNYVFDLLQRVHQNMNLYTLMNTEHLLHITIIAIHSQYRGLRLTEKLIESTIEKAKQNSKIGGIYSEATSSFSSRAFRKQGFQVYGELIYRDFDGIRLSSLVGEHDRCQLLIKEL